MQRRTFCKISTLFFANTLLANSVFKTVEQLAKEQKREVKDIFEDLKFYPENFNSYKENQKEYFIFPYIKEQNSFFAFVDKENFKIKRLIPNPKDNDRVLNPNLFEVEQGEINYPLKRAKNSKRGDGKWEKIEWNQAIDEISAKLKSSKAQKNFILENSSNRLLLETIKSKLNIKPLLELESKKLYSDLKNADLILSLFKDCQEAIKIRKRKDIKLVTIDLIATNTFSSSDLKLSCFEYNLKYIIYYVIHSLLKDNIAKFNLVQNTPEELIKYFKKYDLGYVSKYLNIDSAKLNSLYHLIKNSKNLQIVTDNPSEEILLLLALKDSLKIEKDKNRLDLVFAHILNDIEYITDKNSFDKLTLFSPNRNNIVFDSLDSFRVIQTLKDERKIELSFDFARNFNETNWFCDYILPTDSFELQHIQKNRKEKFLFKKPLANMLIDKISDEKLTILETNQKLFNRDISDESEFWIEVLKKLNIKTKNSSHELFKEILSEVAKDVDFEKLLKESIFIKDNNYKKESFRFIESNSYEKFNLSQNNAFYLHNFTPAFDKNSDYMNRVFKNHSPLWISKSDAKTLNLKDLEVVRVRIIDETTKLESGYFVAMIKITDAIREKTLAMDLNIGRWRVLNSIKPINSNNNLKLNKNQNLANFILDGEIIEFNFKNETTALWQNPLLPLKLDSFSKKAINYQKALIEPSVAGDFIGDLRVYHHNNFNIYQTYQSHFL